MGGVNACNCGLSQQQWIGRRDGVLGQWRHVRRQFRQSNTVFASREFIRARSARKASKPGEWVKSGQVQRAEKARRRTEQKAKISHDAIPRLQEVGVWLRMSGSTGGHHPTRWWCNFPKITWENKETSRSAAVGRNRSDGFAAEEWFGQTGDRHVKRTMQIGL